MNPSKNQQKDPPMLHHDPPMLCFSPASICDAGRCPSRQGAGEGLWRRRHWGDSVGGAGARTGATDVRGGDHLIIPGRQGGRASSQKWAGHPKNAGLAGPWISWIMEITWTWTGVFDNLLWGKQRSGKPMVSLEKRSTNGGF